MDYELEKVTDINEIMKYGVMMPPALAVDGEVKATGKVPPPPRDREYADAVTGTLWSASVCLWGARRQVPASNSDDPACGVSISAG